MADIPQVERQIYILSLLSENRRGYIIEDIVNSLSNIGIDFGKKTIERDIDYITANFFVYEEKKNYKTYSHIDAGGTALGLIDRIISSTPKIDRAYVEKLSDVFKVNNTINYNEKNINTEFLLAIRDAIQNNQTIHVEYYSFNCDEITEREYDSYFLEIQEGCYHLIAIVI